MAKTRESEWGLRKNIRSARSPADTFTAYLQKEGDSARTALFTDYTSDRDIHGQTLFGGSAPTRFVLPLSGNNATAVLDDFYLSTAGFSATLPRRPASRLRRTP